MISYTPTWLSRPSPGYHLFSKSLASQQRNGNISAGQNGSKIAKQFTGNRRIIARRGTELFVVVNNEIRWSDLCMLKDVWEETQQERRKSERDSEERADLNGDFELVDGGVANVNYRVMYLYLRSFQSFGLIMD